MFFLYRVKVGNKKYLTFYAMLSSQIGVTNAIPFAILIVSKYTSFVEFPHFSHYVRAKEGNKICHLIKYILEYWTIALF